MNITQEKLEQVIKDTDTQIQQLVAQLNQLQGAKQAYMQLIEQFGNVEEADIEEDE